MNPFGFALAGAVLLTTSLAAFDTFGQGAPAVPAGAALSAPMSVAAPAQAPAVEAPAADAPRRSVRVILSSPYDRRG